MRFFSDVVWAETLQLSPPSLVSVNVVADSGIRIAWDGAPLWASHVAATLFTPRCFLGKHRGDPEETSRAEYRTFLLSGSPAPGSARIAWTSAFWDGYTTLSDTFHIRLPSDLESSDDQNYADSVC